MELRELRVVVAIADEGSVARAATILHLSPSSVSHSLTTLERKLGARLFHRLARGMVPTEVGVAVLAPARRALREVDAARAAAAAVEGLLAGQVTMVALRVFVAPLADLVAGFHAAHPLVVVSLRQPASDAGVVDLVRSGECELGIMRVGQVPADLEVVPVASESPVLVVPATHRFAGRAAVSLSELDHEPVVSPTSTSPIRKLFDEVFAAAGVTLTTVAEADHFETALELVRAGVGCTLAPADSAAPVLGRGAVAVPVEGLTATVLGVVTRRGQPLAPAAAAFRALATARYGAR
jgi:DNA-binding transcriptional LysR family regulator